MKKKDFKRLFQIFVIVDDFAEDPSFTRHSKLLHTLYIRARRICVSTITATQTFNALSTIIRINATDLFVYRLRNMKDLETFIDEVSAVRDKQTLLELYYTTTSAPYSFLYVKLTAKNR